jgi:hypothetical protein
VHLNQRHNYLSVWPLLALQQNLPRQRIRPLEPSKAEDDLKQGSEWVVQVFKKALCCAVRNPNGPKGMLQHHVQGVECTKIYRC